MHWRPVNHTSRSWTSTEAGYGHIERESNGILTGMYMNHMYTLGTHTEVVTDHEPLIHVYNDPRHPKQLCIDRHRTKLLPFGYNVVVEPGKDTLCDYGSRQDLNWGLLQRIRSSSELLKMMLIFLSIESLKTSCHNTLEMLKTATAKDPVLQQLENDITNTKHCRNAIAKYKQIFDECSYINGVIMRRTQIIIPE